MAAATQELELFVREALGRGARREAVEAALASAGWPPEQVRSVLAGYADIDFPVPVPRPQPYLSPRDAFLYLLLFAALYLSAWHLGSLLFDLINHAFPDAADAAWMVDGRMQSMRWSVASLVIAMPVFLFVARLLAREERANPARRLSAVRRWLTYLTLFVAATVLICDLIALVYNVLGGEITVRFLLKVLVVGVLAGTVFGFYLGDLRREEQVRTGEAEQPQSAPARRAGPGGRTLALAAVAVAAATVAVSVYLIGSPTTQREVRIDQRRVHELQQIGQLVELYAREHGTLPTDLATLAGQPGQRMATADPASGQAYRYEPVGERQYRLCATFSTDTAQPQAPIGRAPSADAAAWNHPAGPHCFERRLDPAVRPD